MSLFQKHTGTCDYPENVKHLQMMQTNPCSSLQFNFFKGGKTHLPLKNTWKGKAEEYMVAEGRRKERNKRNESFIVAGKQYGFELCQ